MAAGIVVGLAQHDPVVQRDATRARPGRRIARREIVPTVTRVMPEE